MTTRRAFLKAVAALPAAAAVPATTAGLLEAGVGSVGATGAGLIGGASLAGFKGAMPAAMAALYGAFHRFDKGETTRMAWRNVYRRHRIAVRRGRMKHEPAKLVWMRHELLMRRREMCGGGTAPKLIGPHKRRLARIRAAMKRAGFPGLPWETAR